MVLTSTELAVVLLSLRGYIAMASLEAELPSLSVSPARRAVSWRADEELREGCGLQRLAMAWGLTLEGGGALPFSFLQSLFPFTRH